MQSPIILPRTPSTRFLPSNPSKKHEKLVLIMCHLSGNSSKTEGFRQQLHKSWNLTVEEGINFLAELFEKGLGYSALNTARSALSSIITFASNISFGTHPLVCRFLKGVFESLPFLPRHNIIWDVRLVLDYL